ncbi:MAG: 4Fe-4S dicluster domain-containing protein [Deltaproteobacteria bacterium]|nr:4Fe-4S dicluster domain-containing protein [Deltaproteobacteria bacterium]
MRLNDGDPAFKHEIAAEPGGEGIKACFACAACSARCPVGEHLPAYDPRRLIRLALLGRREEVLSSPLIWMCSTCYNCQEVCPQQVRFTEVLTAMKNLAARAGHAPTGSRVVRELLAKQGRLLEVTDFENEKRAELGLPPVAACIGAAAEILGQATAPAAPAEDE